MTDSYIIKATSSPNDEASAIVHVSKAIERLDWRENKTAIVKIDGHKLREFYLEFLAMEEKLDKIKNVFSDSE
ncbi:hypothetical protein AB4307_21890 [Vibrio sp. 10N.261.52.C2]|uniref:hypothetical protein n=1 Tax=Vibrio TaxID=662 RepID=UPI00237C98D8|nr:hypothetical protein [Vibrio aestuarianus]MDE1251555.1 hypothetical protein [Vibrio aestuarianus]